MYQIFLVMVLVVSSLVAPTPTGSAAPTPTGSAAPTMAGTVPGKALEALMVAEEDITKRGSLGYGYTLADYEVRYVLTKISGKDTFVVTFRPTFKTLGGEWWYYVDSSTLKIIKSFPME